MNMKVDNKKIVTLYIPMCWWILMGILATRFFVNPPPFEIIESDKDWLIWKILAYNIGFFASGAIIFKVFHSLFLIFLQKDAVYKEIFTYTMFYLVIMSGLVFLKQIIDPLYTGDELQFYLNALNLYPFLCMMTSQVYIISLFLLPVSISPLLIKAVFHAFVVGYIVGQTRIYYKTRWAYLLFGIFMSGPVLRESMKIHRMQWYALLYVLVAVKLYYDNKEKKNMNYHTVLCMCFFVSLLTIWRREGMYLFVLGLLGILFVYGANVNRKKIVISFFIIDLLCFTPVVIHETQAQFSEAGTTWQAWAVHMCGVSGLDREKNESALSKISQKLSMEIVDRYNSEVGEERYYEAYWAWPVPRYKGGRYYAVIKGIPEEKEILFRQGVMELILKNPFIFLKSRVNAWNATAAKSNMNNLYVPLFICIGIAFYSLKKHEYLLAGIFWGVLCHCTLTVIAMPVSYFKYFYEMYLIAYVFGIILLIKNILLRRNRERE